MTLLTAQRSQSGQLLNELFMPFIPLYLSRSWSSCYHADMHLFDADETCAKQSITRLRARLTPAIRPLKAVIGSL